MDDEGGMASDDRRANDSKPNNPFKMPSDEEIFSLRDDERARKEEERKQFLSLPVSDMQLLNRSWMWLECHLECLPVAYALAGVRCGLAFPPANHAWCWGRGQFASEHELRTPSDQRFGADALEWAAGVILLAQSHRCHPVTAGASQDNMVFTRWVDDQRDQGRGGGSGGFDGQQEEKVRRVAHPLPPHFAHRIVSAPPATFPGCGFCGERNATVLIEL